ncbi:MAG: heme-copper oxidase subunit III [Deltaproteobacteria bacterium]|nr:MAG: heme-copper oxidase subunit III [Deltaproteobacteria bacterium]
MTARALAARSRPVVPSALLAVALFVFTEAMLFAGLISSHIVLRGQYEGVWPPADQPRLPVAATGVATVLLLASGVTMWWAVRALDRRQPARATRLLGATLIGGAGFLAMQGYEWARLIGYGLRTADSLYGSLFYTLVGAHALHVIGAVAALAVVTRRAGRGAYARDYVGVRAVRVYWTFVVAVWPPLYALVYLW